MAAEEENGLPASEPALRSRERLWLGLFAVAAFLMPLAYAMFTGHVWEDFFITFRHSANLVEGHGPVFQAGERVHGFTSPLNTLLPAFFHWLFRGETHLPALWAWRLVSAAAHAGAGTLLLRRLLRDPLLPRSASLVLAAFLLLDAKAIAFAANGQEAGFMLLFLTLALLAAERGHASSWRIAGLAWAGLMWTRPDGCVYVAILSLVALLFAKTGRRAELLGISRAAAVTTLLYLPWFCWAWWWFGSPVPHTLVAKAAGGTGGSAADFLQRVLGQVPEAAAQAFEPIYAGFGGWGDGIPLAATLAGLAVIAWGFVRSTDRLGRMAALSFALLCLYFGVIAGHGYMSPWYLPPADLLAGIVVATAGGTLARSRSGRVPATCAQLLILALVATVAAGTWVQMRAQQRIIEEGQRRVIGTWLRDHVAENERVYLETLGYIGWYSGVRIVDWPGLVSPEVVELRARGAAFGDVALVLRPEWMVVRPREARAILQHEQLGREYSVVKTFDVTAEIDAVGLLPGRAYLESDARFLVLRRTRPDATD